MQADASMIVRLLGALEVRAGDGRDVTPPGKKLRALLACLALSPERGWPRERLTALLWGDRDEEQARSSLRQALAELRRLLGEPSPLRADRHMVAFDGTAATIDVVEFVRLAAAGDLAQAASLYRGELLDGLTPSDAGFTDWLVVERTRLRDLAIDVLARLVNSQTGETAILTAQRLLQLDPLREETHRMLMRLYATAGQRAQALRQYQICRDSLQREMDLKPEPETALLRREIQSSRNGAAATPRHPDQQAMSEMASEDLPRPTDQPVATSAAAAAASRTPRSFVMKRRMAAIMAGNVVGYSSMMEKAEERTSERLGACHDLISEKVVLLDGRIFSTAGDAMLAEFPSAINAVRCAVEIRTGLAGADGADNEPMRMRFGLHLADVVVRGDDLVGDGVNLATRIEQSAEPDSILVSGILFDQVRRNSPFVFEDLGEQSFKNISEPIRVYRVRGEIGAHRLQSAPTRTGGAREKRPSSVAILPFHATGDDENQRFLAEGLTEELIVELGRFRRLSVSSRSASFALSGLQIDPVKIGDALAVRYVVEGQVRKIGDHIRIGLTLTETETGSVVWSDKSTRPFTELIDALDQTIGKIAATVVGRVEDASMIAARRKQPENMTAFECLLRGVDHNRLGGVTDDNAREAVKWFTKAIEADPNYAAAYAWRVCAASWLADFDFDEGQLDIRRALELDPNDPEAHRIMGVLELFKDNFDQARARSVKAMELNPSDAYIKARCAGVMTYIGEAEHSLVLLDEAEALDPFLPVWCVEERGVALYALEHYEEALKVLAGLVFQTYRSRLYRAAALVALDRSDEGRKLVKEAMAGNAGLTVSGILTKERYRDLEKRRELERRLEGAGLPRS